MARWPRSAARNIWCSWPQAVVTVINAEDYGRAIHDLFLRRQLIGVGEDIVNEAYSYDPDITAIDQIERSEMRLFNLAEGGQVDGGPKKFDRRARRARSTWREVAYKRDSHVTGVPTGLRDLDRKLGGLQPSDLVILAGRPSMGKTALATNIGFNAAEADRRTAESRQPGHRVAFFSLEMSAEQLAHRIMAEKSGISSDRIRRGEVQGRRFRQDRRGGAGDDQRPVLHRRHAGHDASRPCAPARGG